VSRDNRSCSLSFLTARLANSFLDPFFPSLAPAFDLSLSFSCHSFSSKLEYLVRLSTVLRNILYSHDRQAVFRGLALSNCPDQAEENASENQDDGSDRPD
jgi:hypothetical protein